MYVRNESILQDALNTETEVDYIRAEISRLSIYVQNYLTAANNYVKRSIEAGNNAVAAVDHDEAASWFRQMKTEVNDAASSRADALSTENDIVELEGKLAILTGNQSVYELTCPQI